MAHFFLLCNVLIVKCLTLFPDPYVEQILTENSCVFLQKVLTFCHPPQINLHSQCFTRPQVKAAKSLSHFTGALRMFQRKTCQASALLETLKHTEDAEPKQLVLIFVYIPWNFTLACLRFFFSCNHHKFKQSNFNHLLT